MEIIAVDLLWSGMDLGQLLAAVSSAQALAVMIGSPALLVQHRTSIEDRPVVENGLCRFEEWERIVNDRNSRSDAPLVG